MAHDLAESIVGDAGHDGSAQLQEQVRTYRMLAASGSYQGAESLAQLYSDFVAFADQSSPEARVAKDFDRLDGLVQLHMYRQRGVYAKDEE